MKRVFGRTALFGVTVVLFAVLLFPKAGIAQSAGGCPASAEYEAAPAEFPYCNSQSIAPAVPVPPTASPASTETPLGQCLAQWGASDTVYLVAGNPITYQHGVFNPNVQLGGPDDTDPALFQARYGVAINGYYGDTVDERYSIAHVQAALAGPNSPCPGVPANYVPTQQDREDLILLAYPPGSDNSIYNALFWQ